MQKQEIYDWHQSVVITKLKENLLKRNIDFFLC